MQLENVVPWGRNLEEYKSMKLYSDIDRDKKILGCGDGPASVNHTLTKMGVDIISVDPIYQFSNPQIIQRIEETSALVGKQLRANKDDFVWKNIVDVETLIEVRLAAMQEFLSDYETG